MKCTIRTVSRTVVFLAFGILISNAAAVGGTPEKKRLQIVFMLGQSEMAGQAKLCTASYMVQKPLVPPREVTVNAHKAMLHQINGAYLYWQVMNSYGGPEAKKKELKELIVKRTTFRQEFKQHVLDELNKNDGNFRGKHYTSRRGFWLFNMLDEEAEKVGLTPNIRAILDGSDNKFDHVTAYDQISKDSDGRYEKQLELNKLLLKDTTPENFAAFAVAAKAFEAEMMKTAVSAEEKRQAYAQLAEKHLHLPIAKRTHIVGLGTTVGNLTHGPLSVGYGSSTDAIGLEYAAGLALERNVDGPILIVKCVWDNGRASISELWESFPRDAVMEVLDNIKEYHPDYDANAGSDVAGMIWFQGLSDRQNSEYGAHLEALLKEFGTLVKSPKMPVVCATVGTMMFQAVSDDSLVNMGMREVANKPAFKGTVDVVETYKYYPAELQLINSLYHKRKLNDKALLGAVQQATGGKGKYRPPYLGSASFYLLAGNEVGERLARLIK